MSGWRPANNPCRLWSKSLNTPPPTHHSCSCAWAHCNNPRQVEVCWWWMKLEHLGHHGSCRSLTRSHRTAGSGSSRNCWTQSQAHTKYWATHMMLAQHRSSLRGLSCCSKSLQKYRSSCKNLTHSHMMPRSGSSPNCGTHAPASTKNWARNMMLGAHHKSLHESPSYNTSLGTPKLPRLPPAKSRALP